MAKMITGPNGEKRPADASSAAVMVAKIATGEVEENKPRRSFTLMVKKEAEREGDAKAPSPPA